MEKIKNSQEVIEAINKMLSKNGASNKLAEMIDSIIFEYICIGIGCELGDDGVCNIYLLKDIRDMFYKINNEK